MNDREIHKSGYNRTEPRERSKDRFEYDYNRNEIEKRIRELCSVARETNMSILPYIDDSRGKFSDKKAKKFINDILKAGDCSGKEAEFYKAFLYCCLRCFGSEGIYDYETYNEFKRCTSFQDILDKAKIADNDTRWVGDVNELTSYEYNEIERMGLIAPGAKTSFFLALDVLYVWLTDNPVKTLHDEGSEESEIFDEMDDQLIDDFFEEQEQLARDAGYDSVEEYDEAMGKMAEEYFQSDHYQKDVEEDWEKFGEYYEMVERINKRNEPAWEEYKKSFVDTDKFIEMYKNYRKLFFEVGPRGLYNRVEDMIYSYMYNKGLSLCKNDKAVLGELSILEDLTSQLGAALRRSRKRNGL